MSRGSSEAITHLKGLRSILNIRDHGLPTSLLTMLETIDVLHSTLYDSPLFITEHPQTAAENEKIIRGTNILPWLSPLLHAELENFQGRPKSAETEKLQEIVDLLLKLHASCDRVEFPQDRPISDCNPKYEEVAGKCIANMRSWQQNYHNELGSSDALLLAQAYSNSFMIFYHLVRGRPHRDCENQNYVDELYRGISLIKNETWETLPYQRLYLLV
ncbi:hypothetical protein M433DRAFT_140892 [Acidomyces richmondensis BFW]|nr:MAG: hypothetical protein FE78DRAFT_84271 [Acidomyces sp. 'richmondensis']KYG48586.1 hypothetical protein M433DRAFT_140892 [Acidomyces richmondensis BFW]